MKLLYVANIRFPSERAHSAQIAHMCNAFGENGHDVTLLVPKRKNQILEDVSSYYNFKKTFKIQHLFCTPFLVRTRIGYFLNLAVFTLRALFFSLPHNPDIVYSRDEFLLYVLSFIIPSNKIAWESHEAKYNFAVRRLFRINAHVIAISEGIRDFYLKQKKVSNKILVAHDGVDSSFFEQLETKEQSRQRLGLSSEKPIVMYIGGLDRWKGVDTFFEASKCTDDFQFVVIGGKETEIAFFRETYPRVQFLGRRPYKELPNNQQAADILIIPNTSRNALSAYFTSPLKLFAHMTSRVPIVSSEIPSIKNILTCESVYWFESDNPESLAYVLKQVSLDSGGAQIRSAYAFEKSRDFTWVKRAGHLCSFFKKYDD